MFDTLASQIGAAIVVLVCGFAFLKGDEPERIWAGTYMLAWFAGILAQDTTGLYNFNILMMSIDVIMLLVLVGLIWKARRVWPTWAAACQLLIVTSQIVAMTDLRSPASSVITVINLAGYGVLVSLAVGTFWAWQERRAAGLE